MRMNTVRMQVLLLLVALAACGSEEPVHDVNADLPPPENPDVALSRDLTARFYSGDLEELHALFSLEMREEHLPLEKLIALREFVLTEYGEEQEVLDESWKAQGVYRGVKRRVRFEKIVDPVEVRWGFREDEIATLEFKQLGGAETEIR